MTEDNRPLPANSWIREGKGLEFERAVFFTDAVFAIALTLLIVGIAIPELAEATREPSTMLDALGDMFPKFVSFFIGFVLIGRYWMAHHVMFGQLRAINQRLIGINLVYLAFVAFLPFPVGLVGEYEENPVSVLLLAACLATISTLEVVEFHYAYRKGLLARDIPDSAYRWAVAASLVPVGVFLVTSPLAFVSSTLCLMSWLVSIPISTLLEHKAPDEAGAFSIGSQVHDGGGSK
ncbi:MAG: hypothetical protein DCC49_12015 [Acidobacteria bacterium]|nr:MAG: hypothetical protein DCC49_12015 [Acidobacteriota bacterium]